MQPPFRFVTQYRPASTILIALLVVPTGLAQLRSGSLSGSVRDTSGAVVRDAGVEALRIGTGAVLTTATDQSGDFRIASASPGEYSLTVDKPEFRTAVQTGVVVELGSETVINVVLEVGNISEQIEVRAEARSVEASASTISGLIDGRAIRELPLNGRDFLQLATLQAGAPVARAQSRGESTGFGLQVSFAGSRPNQNNFTMDGVSTMTHAGSLPGSINGINLGVDAVREFNVATSGVSAQFGRSAGGVIRAITRSGTNDVHGSVFHFHRNDNLDARNYFDGDEPPEFRRNQFGASLGGPVRRNSTFYFVNYEGFREERGRTDIDTTLSAEARAGRLTSGEVQTDPGVASFLDLYPLPNGRVFGDTGLFIRPNNLVGDQDFFFGRLDHKLSDKDDLFVRYSLDDGARASLTTFAVNASSDSSAQHVAAVEENHVFGPGLINTLRAGFSRSLLATGDTSALDHRADDPGLRFVPRAVGTGVVRVSGLSTFPGGTGGLDADLHVLNSYQLSNDLAWEHGRHLIRFGVRVERIHQNTDSQSTATGEFRFGSIQNLLANRPNRFRGQLEGSDTVRGHRQWISAGYIQDTWRVAPALTLDLGLRYEWASVPSEVHGKVANLDMITSPELRIGDPLFDNPAGRNFAPRIGLAWDLFGDGRTVVRSGYGIYHELLLPQFLLLSGVRNPPFFLRRTVRNPTGSFPNGGPAAAAASSGDPRAERLPRDLGQPYVQQWNLTIEQRLTSDTTLRASYAGSHGLSLSNIVVDANLATPTILEDGRPFWPEDGQRINPNFGQIRNRRFDGHSFYHGLQLQLRKRYSRRFQVIAGYSTSKTIDDSSSYFANAEAANSQFLPFNGDSRFNRGLSGQHVGQNLTLSGVWAPSSPFEGAAGVILRDWQISVIVAGASGLPTSARLGYDAARTQTSRPGVDSGQRPDLSPTADSNPVTGDPGGWVDSSAFLRPTPGFLGNLGRNTVLGPAVFNADLSLVRSFRLPFLGEAAKVDFRAEFFNIANHTNFMLPSQARMQVFTEGGAREDFARITSALESREIQFGLKIIF